MRVRVLILDNRDSFVFNLQHRFHECGATSDVTCSEDVDIGEIARNYDAVCISPGPGHPHDAGDSVAVIRSLSGRVPILGVCLGHQAIGVAFAATVVPNGRPCHGRATMVRHDGHALFDGISRDFEVGRYHALSIERPLPGALREIATGDDMVMAVAHREHQTFGVQFHPESVLTPDGLRVLSNFLEIARAVPCR